MKPTPSLADFLAPAELAALERPTSRAHGLPGRLYADPAFLELERRALFARGWVAAAAAHELPGAGDAVPVDVAGWPLLLVRGRDGMMRAFHNVCRHRAMAVLSAPCRGALTLRCPWHGWTYDLDGRLRGTPEFAGEARHVVEALERDAHGLLPVRVAQWQDLLFVCLDAAAPPLEQHLADFLRRFEAWDFGAFRHAASWEHVYACNWKIAVEGAIEDYHLSWVHPQITRGAKRADRSLVETDGAAWYGVCGRSEADVPARRGGGDEPPLPALAGLADEDARSVWFVSLFPSGVAGFDRNHLYLGSWLPQGVDRTRLRFHLYFVGEEGAHDPRFAATRQRYLQAVRDVFAQDEAVVAAVQARAAVRDELGIATRFSPFWETAVHAFQRHLVRCLQRAD